MSSLNSYASDLALSSLVATTRVISAAQSEELHALAHDAETVKLRIQQAEQQCLSQLDDTRQQAWDQGYQSGLAAASEKVLSVLQQAERLSTDTAPQLVDLTLETVRALLGALPADLVTPALALQALRKVSDQHARVTLCLHPANCDEVIQRLQSGETNAGHGVRFEVQEDPTLDQLDCRLETELGSVQAGLETQLAAITRALKMEMGVG